MARDSNDQVFNESFQGTDIVESGQHLAEVFGRADKLCFQFHVSQSGGTNPTLTAKYWTSNDGRHWVTHTVLLNAQNITSTPYDAMVDIGSANNGAFGKLELNLGGTTPSAYVRVHSCGRIN